MCLAGRHRSASLLEKERLKNITQLLRLKPKCLSWLSPTRLLVAHVLETAAVFECVAARQRWTWFVAAKEVLTEMTVPVHSIQPEQGRDN